MIGKNNIFIPVLFLLSILIFLPEDVSADDFCYEWKNNLKHGLMQNNDVRFLQAALVKEDLFPEDLATGNFLDVTLGAVKNFQKKYKEEILSPWNLQYGTGFVGKTTRDKLNKLYACGGSVSVSAPGAESLSPKIDSVSPASGPAGTEVILFGSNFTSVGNTVYAGYTVFDNLSSFDGKTLTFIMSPPIPPELKSFPFVLSFGFYVENKNGLSNPGLFNMTFKKNLASSVSVFLKRLIDYLRPRESRAVGFIPFGGKILMARYCCNGIEITVGPPRGGRFLFAEGSMLYSYYQIYRSGPWVLGDAYSGGVCSEIASECEEETPVTGTINQVGTSL